MREHIRLRESDAVHADPPIVHDDRLARQPDDTLDDATAELR